MTKGVYILEGVPEEDVEICLVRSPGVKESITLSDMTRVMLIVVELPDKNDN